MLFLEFLFCDVDQEQHVSDDVPSPHSSRFLDQPVQPFQAVLLPPFRSTLHGSRKEVEYRSDGTAVAVNVQLLPVRVEPFLLFRRRHADPEQIRISFVDRFDDLPVLLVAEFRLVGWGIRLYRDIRIYLRSPELDQSQYPFTAPHEETFASPPVQLFHFMFKQVPSCNPFLRLRFGFQPPAGHYDAGPVRHQGIPLLESLCKKRILLCRVIRMCIDGVDQHLAFRQ